MSENSFDARAGLEVGDRSYETYRLDALQASYDVARLPFLVIWKPRRLQAQTAR